MDTGVLPNYLVFSDSVFTCLVGMELYHYVFLSVILFLRVMDRRANFWPSPLYQHYHHYYRHHSRHLLAELAPPWKHNGLATSCAMKPELVIYLILWHLTFFSFFLSWDGKYGHLGAVMTGAE
jgi:hypothetical protein